VTYTVYVVCLDCVYSWPIKNSNSLSTFVVYLSTVYRELTTHNLTHAVKRDVNSVEKKSIGHVDHGHELRFCCNILTILFWSELYRHEFSTDSVVTVSRSRQTRSRLQPSSNPLTPTVAIWIQV